MNKSDIAFALLIIIMDYLVMWGMFRDLLLSFILGTLFLLLLVIFILIDMLLKGVFK